MDQTGSRTALATAYMRAAHQLLDDPPLLFSDPVALPLLGERAGEIIRGRLDRFQSPGGKALRSHVCLRSRFAEDRLAQAVARGAKAYVLVGAGFDSFAFRQPDWARRIHIFEVDHPATQAEKRERIASSNLCVPDNMTFVANDFSERSLGEALARTGLSREEAVFFSWLGVCMYLKQAAIVETLSAMATFAAGSEVVLTFKQPDGAENSGKLADTVAAVGEAFVSFFTPDEMDALLRRCGFSDIAFLTPQDAQAAYFTPPRHDLPAPARTNIVSAAK